MLVGKVAEKEVVEDRSRLENDRLVEEKLLVSALECPVCLTLPHSAPVYTCRVGHSVCGRCWRSLLKQRCPVCLTEYNRPPTRSFLAEGLLELVERPCRGEHVGCKVRCLGSRALQEHEDQCELVKERLCKKCKSFQDSDQCQHCERSTSQSRHVGLHPAFWGFSLGLLLFLAQHFLAGAIHWSHWLGVLVRPMQRADCPTVALYWLWPDTFLPSSLDSAVWRPLEDHLDNGTFLLTWDRRTQAYEHANETRFGATQSSPPVQAALTWKLILPTSLRVCRVQLFSSNHNSNNKGLQLIDSDVKVEYSLSSLLRDWWREELWQSSELLVVAILTDHCHLDNLQWRVLTAADGGCWKPNKQQWWHWA